MDLLYEDEGGANTESEIIFYLDIVRALRRIYIARGFREKDDIGGPDPDSPPWQDVGGNKSCRMKRPSRL